MKKLFVLSTVLLATAAASRAGVNLHVGIPLPPLPPLPRIVIGAPAPRVVVREEAVCEPAPVVVAPAPVVIAPPVSCAPPPVICAPAPRVVYAPSHRYYAHEYGRDGGYHHDRYEHGYRR